MEGVKNSALGASWERFTRSAGEFAAAVSRLLAVRWTMARTEARLWGRALAARMLLLVAGAALLLLALLLLTAGLVAIVLAWTGSLIGSIFIVLGVYLILAGAALFFGTRQRSGRPAFEVTARELKKDFEHFGSRTP